jgi:GNAT superfamily N-acetyltransferase
LSDPNGFSIMYNFVRGRQLEGTFPGNATTGNWIISSARIARGWGMPPEEAWPYDGNVAPWPPSEPPGIDDIAKQCRASLYQRVKTLNECKAVIAKMQAGVLLSVEITDRWYTAPQGKIPLSSLEDEQVGSHSIVLEGYDDSQGSFTFANSWGVQWGDKGYGYIPYEVFEATWIEGWILELAEPGPPRKASAAVMEYAWAVTELGGGLLHCREFVGPGEERIGWAFVVQRAQTMEVEELFVRPQFRREGYGNRLMSAVIQLARQAGCSLQFCISYPDCVADNLRVFAEIADRAGFQVCKSQFRWAPFVAVRAGASLLHATVPTLVDRPRAPYRP